MAKRESVRVAKRKACAQLARWAAGQAETSGGNSETAWTQLAEEMTRRSGRGPREHPRDPNQTEIDYDAGSKG